jgi:hypothetical protein
MRYLRAVRNAVAGGLLRFDIGMSRQLDQKLLPRQMLVVFQPELEQLIGRRNFLR